MNKKKQQYKDNNYLSKKKIKMTKMCENQEE